MAEEGGATAYTTSSSYGGGGAGGKFHKKPLRRQKTPYERPPTALRGNNDNNSSWLKKLVVQPASKLISYGAGRLFSSILHRSLPPPSPPEPPEAVGSDGVQGTFVNRPDGAQEPSGSDYRHPPPNSSSSDAISELEQLLKQRTFTRSEIVHLRELLHSRAVEVEVSLENVRHKNEDHALDFGRHQQSSSGLFEENRNRGNTSSDFMATPIANSKVIEDGNASPAELAKAYMGSRPLKVSPSALGMRSRVGREDTWLPSSLTPASGSPIMASAKKNPNSMTAPVNGFLTPRSRGRSAIYSMARTPYSKVHPNSNLQGNRFNSEGYTGPLMSSSSISPKENDEKFESHSMSLKRRSSALDNEVGSVGPIRRIRQKSNLLASGLPNTTRGLGIGSHAKQKLPRTAEPSHNVSKDVGESVPNSSYAHVPTKSSEVASKILQHLENMTPKEKSSECKVARSETSHLTLTPSMLSGQALRSMEDVNSRKLLSDVNSNATLANGCDFSKQKQQKVEEDRPKESAAPSSKWKLIENNDSVVSLKDSVPSTSATDFLVKTGPSQPPQKKRAFRMSAQEEYFEQDDDAQCNGFVSRPFSGKKRPTTEAPFTDNKVAPSDESKLVKPSQPADGSPVALGEVSSVVSLPATEETTTAAQSAVPSLSFAAFDKPKDSINSPTFGFSSKVVENVTSFLPSNSGKEAELKIETPSSSVNVPTSAAFQVKNPEYLLTAGDVNGKSDIVPSAASNGPPHFSSPPPVTFTADSSNDTNQIFKSSDFVSKNSSTSTSTPATTSSDSIFGLTAKTSSLPVFKFDPVSAASTTSVSVVAENGSKSEMVQNSGSFSSSVPNVAFVAAASSGSNTIGFGSSVSSPAPANLQASISASASRPFISGMGTGVQDKSTQSLNSSQVLNQSNIFGLTPPVTSTEKSALVTSTGPTSSVFKFGTNYTDGSAVSSSTGATTGTFGFGLNSSSSASVFNFSGASSGSAPLTTGAFGSSSGSVFNFSAASSGSAPLTNTATASSLTSGTSSAVFAFGGKSLTSSSSSSSAPSNNSLFSSSWQQSPNASKFGSSAFTAPSPSTEFASSSSSSSSPSTSIFNSSSSGPTFSFTTPSFGNNPASTFSSGFGAAAAASPDQMNAEDSMAEDPVQQQSSAALVPPMFGQTAPSFGQPPPASSGPTMFGQTAPSSIPGFAFGSQPGQFMFNGQQNQVAPPQNPFQASGNVEFNAGGSFSLGSGGGDKSGRKIVKISRSKNRKK